MWSADLAHGGSHYTDQARTRKSFVTHYCPANVYPMYFHYGRYSAPEPWSEGGQFCSAEKVLWRAG